MNEFKIRELLPINVLHELSKIQPLRAEMRVIAEYFIIFAFANLIISGFLSLWFLPLVLFIIASRQHALLVLMHESTHHRISKIMFLNDITGELIAWNFFASMHGYRHHHSLHHKLENLNTMKDPDWARKQNYQWLFPMRKKDFIYMLMRDYMIQTQTEIISL